MVRGAVHTVLILLHLGHILVTSQMVCRNDWNLIGREKKSRREQQRKDSGEMEIVSLVKALHIYPNITAEHLFRITISDALKSLQQLRDEPMH